MTFSLINSNLPVDIPQSFNLSAPVVVASIGQSTALLLTINSFYKYGGANPISTEITEPTATYNLYKITLPFLSVLNVKIAGFSGVNNINQLTGQRFYLEDTAVYIASFTPPASIQLTIEIPSPIPLVPCELTSVLPVGMSVTQILYNGIPLNFAQTGQNLVIDCSDSCCRIRGGELIQVTGDYSVSLEPINQLHVFNINQNLVIDYVEWRGQRFIEYLGDSLSGCFLWDTITQSLKLIP